MVFTTTTHGSYIGTNTVTTASSLYTSTISAAPVASFNLADIKSRLDEIESILGIPEKDRNLEEKYPTLKNLRKEYIQQLKKSVKCKNLTVLRNRYKILKEKLKILEILKSG